MAGQTLPILYSFRRCPYAMRSRMALLYSQQAVELREVVLRNKPPCLLQHSPKATVPVLVLTNGTVLEESLAIMHWALQQQDGEQWWQGLSAELQQQAHDLMAENDGEFKYWLDRYKYADRYPEASVVDYRRNAEVFLSRLEQHLASRRFLLTDSISLADVAIMPFIRQFAAVDSPWFEQSPYRNLLHWLEGWLNAALFQQVMIKYPAWQAGDVPTVFTPQRPVQ